MRLFLDGHFNRIAKVFFLDSPFTRCQRHVLSLFLVVLLIAPHPAFQFRKQKDRVLPPTYWVEAQNREAFRLWHERARHYLSTSFVISPLQESRRIALTEEGTIYKAPAFADTEIILALNTFKAEMLTNKKNQAKFIYQEALIDNLDIKSGADAKALANQYHVSYKKISFKETKKITKLENVLLNKFRVRGQMHAYHPNSTQKRMIVSGLSFQGEWLDGFNAANTHMGSFQAGEESTQMLMMQKNGYHGYFEGDDFQSLDLRYGDGKISLILFLPLHGYALADFFKDLSYENWIEWMDSYIERRGMVRLPKIKIESLGRACCQLTTFEVAEKGARDGFRYDMADVLGLEKRFEFNARRPFFFAVRDNETDLILLMGQFTGSLGTVSVKKLQV